MKKLSLSRKKYVWEQIVDAGFGDRDNSYIWSMEEYNNYLYVGTLNDVKGCKIYRTKNGNKGSWNQVNIDGFGNGSNSAGARNMIVYKNLLWVATSSWNIGTQIWVTNGLKDKDGLIIWKQVNKNGFGKGKKIPSTRSSCIYKDKLFFGTRGLDNPYIFRYDGPDKFEELDPDNWVMINEELNSNPNHNLNLTLPGEMIKYNNGGKEHLYIGIYIDAVPLIDPLLEDFTLRNFFNLIRLIFLKCEIWRYDGNTWELVIKKGFGRSNTMAISAQVIDNTLYFGTHNMLGGEIWKTGDGTNWMPLIKRGFYNIFNFGIWGMYVYNNRLVVGTENPLQGCQIWISSSKLPGTIKDFQKINTSGMKKKLFNFIRLKQDGIQEFGIFKEQLYIGTACWMACALRLRSPGCEIWRIDNIP